MQWAGKARYASFVIDTVSLHVHERIDPKTTIDSVTEEDEGSQQVSLFETLKRPLRKEIEFYKHRDDWINRLVDSESLVVLNSFLEKEGDQLLCEWGL